MVVDRCDPGPSGRTDAIVTKPHTEFAYIGPNLRYLVPGYRHEWIFVGSNSKNTRIVFIKRPISLP